MRMCFKTWLTEDEIKYKDRSGYVLAIGYGDSYHVPDETDILDEPSQNKRATQYTKEQFDTVDKAVKRFQDYINQLVRTAQAAFSGTTTEERQINHLSITQYVQSGGIAPRNVDLVWWNRHKSGENLGIAPLQFGPSARTLPQITKLVIPKIGNVPTLNMQPRPAPVLQQGNQSNVATAHY